MGCPPLNQYAIVVPTAAYKSRKTQAVTRYNEICFLEATLHQIRQ